MTKPPGKPADNPADPFKKALAEATRVLADDRDLVVSYSVDPPGRTNESVRLPQVSRRMTRDEVLLARGTADAYALRHRHHDAGVNARYLPAGNMARELYDAMETARCEAVGARTMPGTAGNIEAKIGAEARRRGYGEVADKAQAPLSVAAGYWLREKATGRPLPDAARNVLDLWRGFIDEATGDRHGAIGDALHDQRAFARLARRLIDDLGYGDQLGDDPDAEDDEADDDGAPDDAEEEPDSTGQDEEDDEAEASPENAQEDQQDPSQAQVSMDDMADQEGAEEAEAPEADEASDPPPPPPVSEADPGYAVFSTAFDEVVQATDLAEPAELERLRAYLDQQLEPLKGARSVGWRTACSGGSRRSRTGPGPSTWRRASSTPGGWRGSSPTRRRPCPSRWSRTPSSATPW